MPGRQEFDFILTLSLITAPQGKNYYYTHFTDEETEAQRGQSK